MSTVRPASAPATRFTKLSDNISKGKMQLQCKRSSPGEVYVLPYLFIKLITSIVYSLWGIVINFIGVTFWIVLPVPLHTHR